MAVRDFPTKKSTPAQPKAQPVPQPLCGYVSGCGKLNIREAPDLYSNVLLVAEEYTKLVIDMHKSTRDWFHVYTESGVDGYCMKKYVAYGS